MSITAMRPTALVRPFDTMRTNIKQKKLRNDKQGTNSSHQNDWQMEFLKRRKIQGFYLLFAGIIIIFYTIADNVFIDYFSPRAYSGFFILTIISILLLFSGLSILTSKGYHETLLVIAGIGLIIDSVLKCFIIATDILGFEIIFEVLVLLNLLYVRYVDNGKSRV